MRGGDVLFYTTASSANTFKTNVGIGSPPTHYTLIVDTGSANTWVSARRSHPFKPTSTSRETNRNLAINYGTGKFRGKLWYDRVMIGGLVLENQGIGVAEYASGFGPDVDGTLGLGVTELTKESLVKDKNEDYGLEVIPTVLDNLFAQRKIRQKTIAINFERMSTTIKSDGYAGRFHGILTFGGTDPSRHVGEITFVPVPENRPCSKHWSFEQRVTYGTSPSNATEILKSATGVIDTGSSTVHLTSSAFDAYRSATRADLDFASDILSLPEHQRGNLKSLFFEIGGTTFEIPPEEQIWPQELNEVAGGLAEDAYLVFVDLVSNNGVDISLINGFTWLQHFYIVLDAEDRRIGFAKSSSSSFAAEVGSAEADSMSPLAATGKPGARRWPVLGLLRGWITAVLSPLVTFLRIPHCALPLSLHSSYTPPGNSNEG